MVHNLEDALTAAPRERRNRPDAPQKGQPGGRRFVAAAAERRRRAAPTKRRPPPRRGCRGGAAGDRAGHRSRRARRVVSGRARARPALRPHRAPARAADQRSGGGRLRRRHRHEDRRRAGRLVLRLPVRGGARSAHQCLRRPGGYVYVHSGLLGRARNDEVAAVLGHEIAHVHGHHIVRQQAYASLLGMLLSVVQPAVGSLAAAASAAAATLKYQREFEQEADYNGARYMKAAGYDPRATCSTSSRPSPTRVESHPRPRRPYLQTHPMTSLESVLKTQQWSKRDRARRRRAAAGAGAGAGTHELPNDVVTAYRQALDAAPSDRRRSTCTAWSVFETSPTPPRKRCRPPRRRPRCRRPRARAPGAAPARARQGARAVDEQFLARQPDDAGRALELA